MSTFPTEIWSRVISFLVRDTPPPQDCKYWLELSQPDLCCAMRINSMFHDLTAPYLYDKVVVANIVAFMRNFDPTKAKSDNHITPRVKTKNELLAYVRKIDLVYFSTIEATYRDIANGVNTCSPDLARPVHGEKFRSKQEVLTEYNEIIAIQYFGYDRRTRSWWTLPERRNAWKNPPMDALNELRTSLARSQYVSLSILYASKSSHYCVHTTSGPLRMPFDYVHNPSVPHDLKSFTWYLEDPITNRSNDWRGNDLVKWPTIIGGTVNRWIPDRHTIRYNLASPKLRSDLSYIANRFQRCYNTWSNVNGPNPKFAPDRETISLDNTTVEIYAFLNLRPYSDEGLDRFDMDTAISIRNKEHKMLADAQAVLDGMLIPEWKGKVELKLSYKAPDCECCGYKAKQFPMQSRCISMEEYYSLYA